MEFDDDGLSRLLDVVVDGEEVQEDRSDVGGKENGVEARADGGVDERIVDTERSSSREEEGDREGGVGVITVEGELVGSLVLFDPL